MGLPAIKQSPCPAEYQVNRAFLGEGKIECQAEKIGEFEGGKWGVVPVGCGPQWGVSGTCGLLSEPAAEAGMLGPDGKGLS